MFYQSYYCRLSIYLFYIKFKFSEFAARFSSHFLRSDRKRKSMGPGPQVLIRMKFEIYGLNYVAKLPLLLKESEGLQISQGFPPKTISVF